MQTRYFVTAKKRDTAPIYVRLSAGRGIDLIVQTGLIVAPERWSNATQTIKQRINTDKDTDLIKKLKELKDKIETEYVTRHSDYTKEWLKDVIDSYHSKKVANSKSLNEYIVSFIAAAENGEKKNKSAMDFATGTVRIFKGFQRIFNEYQGVYTEKRIEWHKDKEKHGGKEKPLRPVKKVDFNDINIDFYNSFVNFLSDEGYSLNTQGRFVKSLKMIMKKALQDKKHTNREFEYEAFRGITEKSFSIYLTEEEMDKIYRHDLTAFPRMALARDKFIALCETALRISDYNKIDINIRTIQVPSQAQSKSKAPQHNKFIDIIQTKTGGRVVIPLTPRLEAILKNHGNKLPKIPEQYVNEYIKIICKQCGIDEMFRWEIVKFGKTYERTAHKWEKVSCHTGRRTACTNMYKAGIPLKDIRAISGHASDKQLLEYIKVSAEETAIKLSQHPYFTKLRAV